MTTDERPDPPFELLADLPTVAPSQTSQRRMHARCQAALARQRIEAGHLRLAWAVVDGAAFGAIALYLAGVIAVALRTMRLA